MSQLSGDRALVLFSGGQDSTICLAWALNKWSHVETVGFDYGQRHRVELECRHEIRKKLPSISTVWGSRLGKDHTISIDALSKLSDTALTREVEIAFGENGIPNTFVPGRNLIFLAFAAALGFRRDLINIVGGMCETDYSGYPDCRDDTIKAMQVVLNLGMGTRFLLHTPLMWIDKASTWEMASEIGGAPFVELVRTETHSCYLGDRSTLHSWGYGCGDCPACLLRANGYEKFDSSRTNIHTD